jgi:hypothetical protein
VTAMPDDQRCKLTLVLTGNRIHVINDIPYHQVNTAITTLADGKSLDLQFPDAVGDHVLRTVVFPAHVVSAEVHRIQQ